MVRILEGGKKIVNKEDAFYDNEILKGITNEWQKGNKVIHGVLGKMKIKTGDVFLLWRMIKLAEAEKIELHGDTTKGWKEFEVKLKSFAPEIVETTNPS